MHHTHTYRCGCLIYGVHGCTHVCMYAYTQMYACMPIHTYVQFLYHRYRHHCFKSVTVFQALLNFPLKSYSPPLQWSSRVFLPTGAVPPGSTTTLKQASTRFHMSMPSQHFSSHPNRLHPGLLHNSLLVW